MNQLLQQGREYFDWEDAKMAGECELSIVMPCLNEAETLATCIRKAQSAIEAHGLDAEIVVADNGSTDGSQEVAREHKARVVHVKRKGYGAALIGGIRAARGKYVIMGDADDSYDFSMIYPFVEKLRQGYDLVMGSRLPSGGGTIQDNAMPWKHRWIGNPALSGLGRLFFRSNVHDFHCGLRGFKKEAFYRMELRTTGMEFASEMVVKATQKGMWITEVPITLFPDGRSKAPHLRSWRDGWRHLRFMLLYSPKWLFFYPGSVLLILGFLAMVTLLIGHRQVGGVLVGVHTMLGAAAAMLIGYQGISFAVFTKIFAVSVGLSPENKRLTQLFSHITLETGLLCGGAALLAGIGFAVRTFIFWAKAGYGPLDIEATMEWVIPSFTLIMIGLQTVLYSFFLSILGLEREDTT